MSFAPKRNEASNEGICGWVGELQKKICNLKKDKN